MNKQTNYSSQRSSITLLSLATQGPERDVEVSEHAARSRQGVARPPQAAGGMYLLAYHKKMFLRNLKYLSHVYIAFLASAVRGQQHSHVWEADEYCQ